MALAENQITLEVVNDGQDGEAGKSAYESAQEGGYSGTETQFNSDLADVPETKQIAKNTAGHFYHDDKGAHVLGDTYRTDIKDGLKIVKNSDDVPVATFEEKLVKIGEDSVDAEVQLCGGSGHISYDKAKHRLLITNKMDANESIAIETNFDSGGDEPYALMDLYRNTPQETAKFELETSSGDDGKEVFILGSVSGNTSGAGTNRLNLQARDIQIGTENFLEPTLKILAQDIDIGLERPIYHEYPTVIWVHGQMILDDEQEIWIGDGKVCTGEFLEIYGSNSVATTRTISNADTYYGAHSGGNWTYRTQNGVRGIVPYWASVPESSATGKITITKSGTYRIDYQIHLYTGFTAGDRIAVGILKNYLSTSSPGASNERVAYARVQDAAAYLTVGGYCLVECEERDDLRLAAKNITAGRGTISLSAISKMLITRVGM